ncbi:hypothetical protein PSAC2689_10408 [Paraburkholderia sacchari]
MRYDPVNPGAGPACHNPLTASTNGVRIRL